MFASFNAAGITDGNHVKRLTNKLISQTKFCILLNYFHKNISFLGSLQSTKQLPYFIIARILG